MHPLDKIRVVEFAAYLQGPMASQFLLEYGAEVIKIEEPVVGDPVRGLVVQNDVPVALGQGRNFLFELYHGNKKSIAVNLKSEQGKQVICDLIKKSDVFLSNYRKSVLESLGLDYKTLSRHNPRLIYATGNGYGPKGPDADVIGYDLTTEARSGMMEVQAQSGIPYWNRNYPVDIMSSVLLAFGVILAWVARERYGIGQEVNTSLLASSMELMRLPITSLLWTGQPGIKISRDTSRNPLWGCYYRCRDDRWIMLSMSRYDKYWPTLCKALGRPDLEKDPRFANRDKVVENSTELIPLLDEIFLTRTSEAWQQAFNAAGELVFGIVKNIAELLEDPQVQANDYIVDFTHEVFGPSKKIGHLIQLAKTPGVVSTSAPELGQHTEEVLLDICGYDWKQIEKLRAQGAIP